MFFSRRLMVIAEIFSLLLYVLSLVILHDYFGKNTMIFFWNEIKVLKCLFFSLFQIGTSFGRLNFCGRCWQSRWSHVYHCILSNFYGKSSHRQHIPNCHESGTMCRQTLHGQNPNIFIIKKSQSVQHRLDR